MGPEFDVFFGDENYTTDIWIKPLLRGLRGRYRDYAVIIRTTPLLYGLRGRYTDKAVVIGTTPSLQGLRRCYMGYAVVIWTTPRSLYGLRRAALWTTPLYRDHAAIVIRTAPPL